MLCTWDPSETHAKLCLFLILHCSFLAVVLMVIVELRYMSLVFCNMTLYEKCEYCSLS